MLVFFTDLIIRDLWNSSSPFPSSSLDSLNADTAAPDFAPWWNPRIFASWQRAARREEHKESPVSSHHPSELYKGSPAKIQKLRQIGSTTHPVVAPPAQPPGTPGTTARHSPRGFGHSQKMGTRKQAAKERGTGRKMLLLQLFRSPAAAPESFLLKSW